MREARSSSIISSALFPREFWISFGSEGFNRSRPVLVSLVNRG